MKLETTIGVNATLLDALRSIDATAAGLCCVVNDHEELTGVVTDGDVRRALIRGAALSDPVAPFVERQPKVVPQGTSRALVMDIMTATRITAVPELTPDGRVNVVHTLNAVLGAQKIPNPAVIMAGGKGTRLGELTKEVPKPLLQVAGRPIIEWIILQLVGAGVQDVFVSINHLGDQIERRLGDGHDLGCHVHYLREDPQLPLGTAGSLTLLPRQCTAEGSPPIIVVNGDLMLEFDAAQLIRDHTESEADITVGTAVYEHTVPFGVVRTDEAGRIISIEEKPTVHLEVNSALYCLNPATVQLLSPGHPSDMPDLIRDCLNRAGLVKAWGVDGEWIDVGTPMDFARARGR